MVTTANPGISKTETAAGGTNRQMGQVSSQLWLTGHDNNVITLAQQYLLLADF